MTFREKSFEDLEAQARQLAQQQDFPALDALVHDVDRIAFLEGYSRPYIAEVVTGLSGREFMEYVEFKVGQYASAMRAVAQAFEDAKSEADMAAARFQLEGAKEDLRSRILEFNLDYALAHQRSPFKQGALQSRLERLYAQHMDDGS